VLLLGLLLPACDDRPAPRGVPAQHGPDTEAGKLFDPATTGTVEGTVCWGGSLPLVRSFRGLDEPLSDLTRRPARERPNPHAPRIDRATYGLASAVVWLRGVDPRKARPWQHEPALVELRDWQLHVRQGKAAQRRTAFVRAGDGIEIVSRQEGLCSVQGRGAAFFSLFVTEPGQVRSRRLPVPGIVELKSGTGQFWMRAYLFVSHHPYLAHPDERGCFRFEQVPAGEYDLVAWHPDWYVEDEERNPELFRIQQLRFRPPFEVVQRVRVEPGRVVERELVVLPR
jgi:hypothetical protein